MNVILAYLESMFRGYPETDRLREAKAELQAMMEDAYAELIAAGRSENEAVGQVISNFGNLDEVAPALGLDESALPGHAATVTSSNVGSVQEPVTMEEAQGYAAAMQRIRYRFAGGVALFLLSPIALVTLPAAAREGVLPFGVDVASFIGLALLLVLITAGVLVVVATQRELAPYRRIPEGRFVPNALVSRWGEDLARRNERARTVAMQIAIGAWILAPLPLLGLALLVPSGTHRQIWTPVGVGFVLLLVAVGLFVLLAQQWAHSVRDDLQRAEHASTSGEAGTSIVGVVAAFYWPALVAIYLAWSFLGDAWGTSWLLWPIGAVLFGAIASGTSAVERYRAGRS